MGPVDNKISSGKPDSNIVSAQVEIIPSKVPLSPEELVDAERQRQLAEKMKGCPFFAGVSREDAPQALKEHQEVMR